VFNSRCVHYIGVCALDTGANLYKNGIYW